MTGAAEDLAWLKKAERKYHPCNVGVHLCGQIEDADGERPLTLGNFACRSHDHARAFWEAAKAEFATEDGDVCVDLNLGGRWGCNHTDDFMMWRQMIPRLAALAEQHNTRMTP
jgi:hypothetical protein